MYEISTSKELFYTSIINSLFLHRSHRLAEFNETLAGPIDNPQYQKNSPQTVTMDTNTGQSVELGAPQYYEIPVASAPPQETELYDTVEREPQYSEANRGEPQPYETPLGNQAGHLRANS